MKQRLHTSMVYRIAFIVIIVLFVGTNIHTFAQKLEDPLKKPELWAKLKKQPTNDQYWRAYFEKDLFSLSQEEYKNYNSWKAQLEADYRVLLEKREIAQQKKREEYYAKRWATPPTEDDYEELSHNVYKNFSIIEQYFEEQYKRHGEKYEAYDTKYPEGKFNKIKWVEEHEQALEMLELNN
ncbi:hypothetical protein R9C00_28635 [Flammeovirgaceae bacterium SG7u.111]|nr:hypothetical protein [Flammeovirgaceae bacterium SG7u.132]WPO35669.1 hypothetical protein R9C00_28635 [Flammeovirgaceae bacterium SG7u.111]